MTRIDYCNGSPLLTKTSCECMFIKCAAHKSAHFQRGYVDVHEIKEVLRYAVPLAFVDEQNVVRQGAL